MGKSMHPLSAINQLTLDQLLLFVSVAETGSFSEAARRLERVQSTVSHGIGQLERQLGIQLFDRSKRKPSLTNAGEHLLTQADQILTQVRHFQSEAQILQGGHEPFVSLVLDMIIPIEIMTWSLKEVQKNYPHVRWLLHTEMLSAITQRVLDGSSQLGLTGQLLPQYRSKLESEVLGHIDFVFVVSKQHPLSKCKTEVSENELNKYTRLAVADRGELGLQVGQSWYLADLHTLLHFVKEGFGWAFLPLHLVKSGIDSGELIQFKRENSPLMHAFTIYSICLRSEKLGPVRKDLLKAIKIAFKIL
jgi:DNA-binding transcriptional LysR family regulator